jgi:hypothetical protein
MLYCAVLYMRGQDVLLKQASGMVSGSPFAQGDGRLEAYGSSIPWQAWPSERRQVKCVSIERLAGQARTR